MEEMFCNMKRELDKVISTKKDKSASNLDRMIWRTDSPFTIEVLNYPLPPKYWLPQLESLMG